MFSFIVSVITVLSIDIIEGKKGGGVKLLFSRFLFLLLKKRFSTL